jgi:hypothetical protein
MNNPPITQSNPSTAITPSSQQPGALAAPADIMECLGQLDRNDMLCIVKQAKKEELTIKKNEISARLHDVTTQLTDLKGELDAIGPARIKEIDLKGFQKVAANLADLGFGKFNAAITYQNRDDDRKVYTYKVMILKAGNTSVGYGGGAEMELKLPFDQATKLLLKQIAQVTAEVQSIQQELLEVKKEFSNIPEMLDAARANIAEIMAERTKGGREFLALIRNRKVVVEA